MVLEGLQGFLIFFRMRYKMKKVLVITALVAGIGLFGLQQASASRGAGAGMGMGMGCPKGAPCYSQLDAATKAKVDKFYDDTKPLRKQIVMKRAEKCAIMNADNPDPAKAAVLAGELFDLRAAMQTKADEAGLSSVIDCDCCVGYGQGMGPHHGAGYGAKKDGLGKKGGALPAADADDGQ